MMAQLIVEDHLVQLKRQQVLEHLMLAMMRHKVVFKILMELMAATLLDHRVQWNSLVTLIKKFAQ